LNNCTPYLIENELKQYKNNCIKDERKCAHKM